MIKKGQTKKIEWEVDENGCHICTSHHKSKAGYFKIKSNGKNKTMHSYVYSQKYLNGEEVKMPLLVRHKCDNPSCINPEHLEIGTSFDNANDRVKRGRGAMGENGGNSKLTTQQVIDIFYSNNRYDVISEKFKISKYIINCIRCGKLWRHVTKDLDKKLVKRKGTFNEMQIIEIFKSEKSINELAEIFNTTNITIKRIKDKTTWAIFTNNL